MKKIMNEYFIHESSYVDNNVTIGAGTKVWHFSHLQSGAVIGKNCILGQNVNVGNNVVIGNNCKIQNSVQIYDGLIIENDVFIGPGVIFTNDYFPRADNLKWKIKKTIIKSGASIGANSTIICGVKIGKRAMVAAGSVVIKDIKDFELHAGNPAKLKKKIKK